MPASVTSSDACARPAARSTQLGGAGRLVVLVVGHDPAGRLDAEARGQPAQPAGVLGRDDVGVGELAGPAAARRRPGRRSGVPARTSTPVVTGSWPPRIRCGPSVHVASACDPGDLDGAAPRRRRAAPRPMPARDGPAGPAAAADARPTGSGAGSAPLLVDRVAGRAAVLAPAAPAQGVMFDETYYVKDAYSLLQFGVERELRRREGGDPTRRTSRSWRRPRRSGRRPATSSTRRCGKWMIAVGRVAVRHRRPFGWRFAVALIGTLAGADASRASAGGCSARRCSAAPPGCCSPSTAMALRAQPHRPARPASDVLGAGARSAALLVDRDRARDAGWRDAARPRPAPGGSARGSACARGGWSPAVCLGLACGVKWSGLYFVAAFCLMTVLLGHRAPAARPGCAPPVAAMPCCATACPRSRRSCCARLAVYLLSWTGWFLGGDDAYCRNWAAREPLGRQLVPGRAADRCGTTTPTCWQFHTGLASDHPYESKPWAWIVLSRPTSFFYEGPKRGEHGCDGRRPAREAITSLGNPLIWWAATLALAVLLVLLVLRRDWRAGAILAGVVARLAALVPVPRAHHLLVLRRGVRAVPRARPHDGAGPGDRPARRASTSDASSARVQRACT